MLITLFFTCQSINSIVTIKHQLGQLVLLSKPNDKLTVNEINSCQQYQTLTALYTVKIGNNTFRSKFISYDWTKDLEIILLPEELSSVLNAIQFTIASIKISFLENNLVQQGSIGQLIVTSYNYNQCIQGKQILIESNQYLDPVIILNKKCKVSTSGDIEYSLFQQDEIIYRNVIPQSEFDFSSLNLAKYDCSFGTPEEKENCKKWTQIVSTTDYLTLTWLMIIPKQITTQNIYFDDYGVLQNQTVKYNFNLTTNRTIAMKKSVENCTGINQVGFYTDTVFIEQTPINTEKPECDINADFNIIYWLRVSELEDNSGEKFQLKFYNEAMYRINKWISCESWEISEFESFEECTKQLLRVAEFPKNMSLQISIYIMAGDVYDGAIHTTSKLVDSGNVSIIVAGSEICMEIDYEADYYRQFIGITLKISNYQKQFSREQFQYHQTNIFEFPSKDNIYCFTGNEKDIEVFNSFIYVSYFGTVEILDSILSIGFMDAFVDDEIFFEGGLFLIGCIITCIVWVVVRSNKCRRRR